MITIKKLTNHISFHYIFPCISGFVLISLCGKYCPRFESYLTERIKSRTHEQLGN
jgi:hypothetical protein